MVRLGILVCMAFWMTASAVAQPINQRLPGPPPPASLNPAASAAAPQASADSIYSQSTIGQFLTACGTDKDACANEVGTALLDEMPLDGSGSVCLPGPDYAGPAVTYLNAHPETHAMPTEEGIFLALRKVYPCD